MKFWLVMILIWMSGFLIGLSLGSYHQRTTMQTAIQDNGQTSHQELSQTKSNADVYNYAALSTSY